MTRPPAYSGLSLDAIEKIDHICWTFERACRRGELPEIDELLGDTAGDARRQLLDELLRLDVYYRVHAGQEVSRESYHVRFPDDRDLVDALFDRREDEGRPQLRRDSTMKDAGGVTGTSLTLAGGIGASDDTNVEGQGASPTRVGRFLVRRELGKGAYGQVLLAFDPQLERDVALKVPRPEVVATDELRERFRQEALAAGALDHPNIVQVHEAGQAGPVSYIASAYCPGSSLADWLRRQSRPVSARSAARLIAALSDAVEHAHSRGVIHRDLKPGNILLTNAESGDATVEEASLDELHPRITDFGLARYVSLGSGGDLTRTSAILGTPSYLSPEQAVGRSKEVGPAADVYGLGAVLYELLSGRAPFIGDSALEVLEQVRSRDPLAPRTLRPKLARDLDTICLKCLQKDPRGRYASAGALGDDLRRFLSGETIAARPVGAPIRVARWCRRKPAIASLAAALVLVVAGSVVGLLLLLAEARAHLRESNENFELARDAVDELYLTAVENPILQRPGMQPVKEMLLLPALEYYEQLIAKRADDPDLREELANNYHRVAVIHDLIGNTNDALEAVTRAAEIRRDLMAANPEISRFRMQRAESCYLAGVQYFRIGQADEGLRWLQRAENLQRELTEEFPDEPDYGYELARTELETARLLLQAKGDAEEAVDRIDRGITIARGLAADHADESRFHVLLARLLQQRAVTFHQQGQLETALENALESRELLAPLADQDESGQTSVRLCNTLSVIAGLQSLRGDVRSGARTFEEVVRVRETLVDDNPDVLRLRYELSRDLSNLASALFNVGQDERAYEASRQSIDILERLVEHDPQSVEFRSMLATALSIHGRALDEEPDRALEALLRSRELFRSLDSEGRLHASKHANFGALLMEIGRIHMANDDFDAAASALYESLERMSEPPVSLQSAYNLILVEIDLAQVHQETGEEAEAGNRFSAAMDRASQLYATNPESATLADALQSATILYAGWHAASERHQERFDVLESGTAAFDQGIAQYPDALFVRHFRAKCVSHKAAALASLGRHDEALQTHLEAVDEYRELIELEDQTFFRRGLSESYRKLAIFYREGGRLEDAEAAAVEIGAVCPDGTIQLVNSACHLALTAQAVEQRDGAGASAAIRCADLAMEALSRAVELGYRDLQLLTEDPDLNYVRDRDDFQQLLDGLQDP